ncbi:GTP-binding protein EngA [Nonlabens ulvanivorans]|nr:hypothetical protein [Nonlabens ulvanivorans]GAK95373.1 GTP-binding protein EngA [Nonlabens ulvanivorans]
MELNNTIILRPRFIITLDCNISIVNSQFEKAKFNRKGYKVSFSDQHIFIRIPKQQQHFWSPQLHLELQKNDMTTEIRGLYGPNPTVWTMFMFLHFVVAILLLGTIIWGGYTMVATHNSINSALVSALLLIFIWLSFYIAGRFGKKKANKQMLQLNAFFHSIIKPIEKP